MKARKDQWHAQMSQSEKNKLAADNDRDAQKLIALGINAIRGADGVWYVDRVGGEKLFEKYHDGGTVGKSKIKSDERITKLQDGEVVVAKDKVGPLYKALDFAAFVTERLGASFAGGLDKSIFSGNLHSMLSPAAGIIAPNQSTQNSFSPIIEVNINGPVTKEIDPVRFGDVIANKTLEKLKDTFFQGGSGAMKSPIFST